MVRVEEIGRLWAVGCEDAGYQPGVDAVLYIVPGSAGDESSAIHVEPSSEVVHTTEWPLAPNQLKSANSPSERALHRIFARDFASPRVALARLRHELEHGRQYDRNSDVYLAMSFVRDALSRSFESSDPEALAGSAALYNALPFELDANRAAARLTASHFGPPSPAELQSTDAPLYRDQSPIEADKLSLRLLAFAALFPDGIAWVADHRGEAVEGLLSRLGVDAHMAWSRLQDDSDAAAFGRAALELRPSVEEISASSTPALAWLAAKEKIEQGQTVAEAFLSDELPDLRLN